MGNRGFSLVELLFGIGLGSIILLALGGAYVFTVRAAKKNDAQVYLQRQAALVMDELALRIRPATALSIATCSSVDNSLLVTQANNNTKYCFRRDSSTAGTKVLREHYPTLSATTPDGTSDLLANALVSVTTVDGPTVDGSGNCGTTAGFCPGVTGAPPATGGSRRATITFQLRYQLPGSQSFQTMAFTTTISRRN